MTAQLGDTDHRRLARDGLAALSPAEGMELFDAALRTAEPMVLPIKLDLGALRAQAATGAVPPLLRGLVPQPRRIRQKAQSAHAHDADALTVRLAGAGSTDRQAILLDLVRQQAAYVLGYASVGRIAPDAAFTDVGFDSLTVIELRDRLLARTGLRLPATFAFDFPTPLTLADHLTTRLGADTTQDPVLAEVARLEELVAARPPDGAKDTGAAARLRALAAKLSTDAPGRPEAPTSKRRSKRRRWTTYWPSSTTSSESWTRRIPTAPTSEGEGDLRWTTTRSWSGTSSG
ncbi:hypothetical protein SSPO_089790 [Streptomyces antimycoticus]|uniref:Carrier domain-containing protein n=1 Tax=Streptomyces antimycoticus TaxID=68175 RepID=A0A499V9R9_9ACTN|nr:acyl carrier protein [Streptomyces antimycoticus]BBJ46261.1 hypothetical protein SSPO_089790 [Streptomyces antimycoticus]